jgi:hypothetical protein
MILLVTSIERRGECAAALQDATAESVTIADDLAQATTLLRGNQYSVVVIDQFLAETEPHAFETVFEHLGTAIPLQVNLAINGTKRIVRNVRSAMHRREREQAAAHKAAQQQLRGDLNETLTTILIDCELALYPEDLPPHALQRMVSIYQTARKLRMQLESAAGGPELRRAIPSPP